MDCEAPREDISSLFQIKGINFDNQNIAPLALKWYYSEISQLPLGHNRRNKYALLTSAEHSSRMPDD